MKIAMIGHKRIPGREGGIEVVVEELTTRMVEKGNVGSISKKEWPLMEGERFSRSMSGHNFFLVVWA